jgi:hypothetical protein
VVAASFNIFLINGRKKMSRKAAQSSKNKSTGNDQKGITSKPDGVRKPPPPPPPPKKK